jgi:hypothetical protein
MLEKITKLRNKFINYWLGEVSVYKNYINCLDKKDKLDTISITPCRFRKATLLTKMDTPYISKIIQDIEAYPKYLHLRLEHGEGIFQEYTFNKHQQKILLKELKNIIETEEFYEEDKEY